MAFRFLSAWLALGPNRTPTRVAQSMTPVLFWVATAETEMWEGDTFWGVGDRLYAGMLDGIWGWLLRQGLGRMWP